MSRTELNNRTLAMQAATKIVESSALGKALTISTDSKEKDNAEQRKDVMKKQLAKMIEETYAPWCNEEFR